MKKGKGNKRKKKDRWKKENQIIKRGTNNKKKNEKYQNKKRIK
jgi:hypothetical protein